MTPARPTGRSRARTATLHRSMAKRRRSRSTGPRRRRGGRRRRGEVPRRRGQISRGLGEIPRRRWLGRRWQWRRRRRGHRDLQKARPEDIRPETVLVRGNRDREAAVRKVPDRGARTVEASVVTDRPMAVDRHLEHAKAIRMVRADCEAVRDVEHRRQRGRLEDRTGVEGPCPPREIDRIGSDVPSVARRGDDRRVRRDRRSIRFADPLEGCERADELIGRRDRAPSDLRALGEGGSEAEGREESAPDLSRRRMARDGSNELAEHHVIRVRVVPTATWSAVRPEHVVEGSRRAPADALVGEDGPVDARVREEVVETARVVEHLPDGHCPRSLRVREPLADRIRQRESVFLLQLEDERGKERLGDAPDREGRTGSDRDSPGQIGPPADPSPGRPVRPDDRHGHPGDLVVGPETVKAGLKCGRRDDRRCCRSCRGDRGRGRPGPAARGSRSDCRLPGPGARGREGERLGREPLASRPAAGDKHGDDDRRGGEHGAGATQPRPAGRHGRWMRLHHAQQGTRPAPPSGPVPSGGLDKSIPPRGIQIADLGVY